MQAQTPTGNGRLGNSDGCIQSTLWRSLHILLCAYWFINTRNIANVVIHQNNWPVNCVCRLPYLWRMFIKRNLILYAACAIILTSCIHDDQDLCGDIILTVHDKNYDNISEAEGISAISENLPLVSYISTLSYWAQRQTALKIRTENPPLPGSQTQYRLTVHNWAAGNYNLTIAGNYVFSASGQPSPVPLHPEFSEGDDIYLKSDRFDNPLCCDRTVSLLRTKGKLLIQFVDFPANAASVDVTVSGICQAVDADFNYSGSVAVSKTFALDSPDEGGWFGMLLAPSAAAGSSANLTVRDINGGAIITTPAIPLTIYRNRLTMLRHRYIREGNRWEVALNVDGNWNTLYYLDIGRDVIP